MADTIETPEVPPADPLAALKRALDHLNHPGNLDLQSRLTALEMAVREIAQMIIGSSHA